MRYQALQCLSHSCSPTRSTFANGILKVGSFVLARWDNERFWIELLVITSHRTIFKLRPNQLNEAVERSASPAASDLLDSTNNLDTVGVQADCWAAICL